MVLELLLAAAIGLPDGQDKEMIHPTPKYYLNPPNGKSISKVKLLTANIEVFAKEPWYTSNKSKEQALTGTLSKVENKNPGPGRFAPFFYVLKYTTVGPFPVEKEVNGQQIVIVVDKSYEQTQEVYVGSKGGTFDSLLGKPIRIEGKRVRVEAEGGSTRSEFWPARITTYSANAPEPPIGTFRQSMSSIPTALVEPQDMKLKIHAKAAWPFASDNDKKGKQLVLRSAGDLVANSSHKLSSAKPEDVQKKATDELAKAFKVNTIDWDKQMVVAVTAGQKPTGGYQIDIQSITTAGKDATVMWKLTAPQGIAIQVLTHPSVMVLVDRAAGEVKFDPAIK